MACSGRKTNQLLRYSLILTILIGACAGPVQEDHTASVRSVLEDQVTAWNAGDIEGYMTGYWRSDSTLFISGGSRLSGYESVLARYKRSYPDRAAMGHLSFEGLEIIPLSPKVMLARGIWRLEREADEPWGRFTLLLEPREGSWRIVYDHTSSAD